MAAQALLNGVGCQSGLEFLQTTRYYTAPPGSSFFAPLDAILEIYDPRAQQESTLNRGDVIEVQGPAASGKTHFLQFIAMTACLPRQWTASLSVRGSSRPPREEDIAIGGREKCVIIVDCDGKFSIERTYHLVRSHLQRRVQEHAATIPALYSAEAKSEELHSAALNALKRVHVFAPGSSLALMATLLKLSRYIHKTCSAEPSFILIDNISAFHWQDRFSAERHSSKIASHNPAMNHVLSSLQQLRIQYGCVIVMTNWAFPSGGDQVVTSDSPFFRQHLSRPYPAPFATGSGVKAVNSPPFDPLHPLPHSNSTFNITHHITLHTPVVKPVSTGATIDNCLREEPVRQMEQQEIGSMAYLRMPGIESGDELGRWELLVRENVVDGL